MKLREFYENNGVDYDAFLRRLMNKESLVEKYIKIFFEDSTYAELTKSVDEKEFNRIRKNAHTLKGIALNLEFIKLSALCNKIVVSAKLENLQEIEAFFGELKLEFERIISELQI